MKQTYNQTYSAKSPEQTYNQTYSAKCTRDQHLEQNMQWKGFLIFMSSKELISVFFSG